VGAFSTSLKEINVANILFIDIETAPVMGKVWALWKQNISLDQIEEDWYIMSYAAKWAHEDEVMYADCRDRIGDDSVLLAEMYLLLNEADFVVAHNGKGFDVPKINARLLLNGYKPPSPFKIIDTLKEAQKTFKMTSNKLAWLTAKLCATPKLDHAKFAGWKLWNECMAGNEEAWEEMKEYNIVDVISLEELYVVLRPWMPTHPNIAIYDGGGDEKARCPKCSSSKLHKRGFIFTNKSQLQRYHCLDCGGWSSETLTMNTREQRKALLASR
jgi:uncharacterized protein YprB with RNaseH-like and TPR domain